MKTISAFLLTCGILSAQTPQTPNENAARMAPGSTPIYRVSVTARTAKAINYQHRSGATKIDFRGTELLPASHGEAKVESKQGYIEIEVEFRNLQPASQVRLRISHLRAVGHHSGRPHRKPRGDPSEWHQQQAGRDH